MKGDAMQVHLAKVARNQIFKTLASTDPQFCNETCIVESERGWSFHPLTVFSGNLPQCPREEQHFDQVEPLDLSIPKVGKSCNNRVENDPTSLKLANEENEYGQNVSPPVKTKRVSGELQNGLDDFENKNISVVINPLTVWDTVLNKTEKCNENHVTDTKEEKTEFRVTRQRSKMDNKEIPETATRHNRAKRRLSDSLQQVSVKQRKRNNRANKSQERQSSSVISKTGMDMLQKFLEIQKKKLAEIQEARRCYSEQYKMSQCYNE